MPWSGSRPTSSSPCGAEDPARYPVARAGDAALGDEGQPAQRLDVAPGERQVAQWLGDQSRRPARGVLLDRHVGLGADRLQADRHPGRTGRPGPSVQHQPMAGHRLQHLGVVVEEQRPGADGVVQPGTDLRPVTVDLAHARGADDPQRVEPAVGEHVPDLLGSGSDAAGVGRHGRSVPTVATAKRPPGKRRTAGVSGHQRFFVAECTHPLGWLSRVRRDLPDVACVTPTPRG